MVVAAASLAIGSRLFHSSDLSVTRPQNVLRSFAPGAHGSCGTGVHTTTRRDGDHNRQFTYTGTARLIRWPKRFSFPVVHMSQFVRDRAYLNSLGFSSSSYYIRWHCVILHTHTQGTPILPSSFCFLFDFFSHLNFKLKFEKNTKVFVRFLLQNDRSQRVVSEMNRPRLTEAAHSKFFFFFPFLFVLQVLNRSHLSPPHSYSLLVDINNRPTLDFSFFFRGSFLFIYFRLVWLSHVVFLSLLFLVQRLPELTTMNRYIFLSVFIYIYIILGCWAGCWAATDRDHRSPPPPPSSRFSTKALSAYISS